ncbi:MAG: hypothetical protein RDV41_15700, partial [Planctomycetota bacterium]|nr:hypothetical protein [Planctomycetota bacterium]
LACYFSMIVAWDAMWFLWNPHFGVKRFKKSEVWWFRHWVFGVPAEYPMGIVVSCAVYLAGAWADLGARAVVWARYIGVLFGCVVVSTLLLSAIRRVRQGRHDSESNFMNKPG